MPPNAILIVDDDPADTALTSLVLRQGVPDARCLEVADGVGFAARLAEGGFDVVVAEAALAWGSGVEALRLVRRRYPRVPCLLFSRQAPVVPEADGSLLAACLRKDSAGYLELPGIVVRQLQDARVRDESVALGRLFAALPAGLLVVDAEGRVARANAAASVLLGRPSGSLEGVAVATVLPGLESRPEWAAVARRQRGGAKVHLPTPHLEASALRLHLWTGEEPGLPAGAVGVLLEGGADPGGTGVALARDPGRDLEQLAYAVSHDLQEPLQLINRNARLLATRCGEQIDSDARRFLDHLINSGERLQGMLDGLLNYSRLGFGKGHSEPVDLTALVDEVLADLGPLLDEAEAEVHRALLPRVHGDPNGLRQLYMNLIGNAIKFRAQRPLHVTLGAEEDGPWWRLVVRDNGIGIDSRFHDGIFGMFQRLHTESEYPGTGIGLAICRKIVEQYGGSIWVESKPEEGASFYFTLPRGGQSEDSGTRPTETEPGAEAGAD